MFTIVFVIVNMFFRLFSSCSIEKGLGGSLVDLKNEIRSECNEFNTWRFKTLAERGRDGTNEVSFNKEGKNLSTHLLLVVEKGEECQNVLFRFSFSYGYSRHISERARRREHIASVRHSKAGKNSGKQEQ